MCVKLYKALIYYLYIVGPKNNLRTCKGIISNLSPSMWLWKDNIMPAASFPGLHHSFGSYSMVQKKSNRVEPENEASLVIRPRLTPHQIVHVIELSPIASFTHSDWYRKKIWVEYVWFFRHTTKKYDLCFLYIHLISNKISFARYGWIIVRQRRKREHRVTETRKQREVRLERARKRVRRYGSRVNTSLFH